MKIITNCIIDIETLCVEYEESYIYNGPIAECKGGGGGGSSGAVEYPDYVELIHCDWLDGVCDHAGTSISSDITAVMNSALGGSPWTALAAYDPDTDISSFEAIVLAFGNAVDEVDPDKDWRDMYVSIKTGTPPPFSISIDDTSVIDATLPGGDLVVGDETVVDAVAVVDASISDATAVADATVGDAVAVVDAVVADADAVIDADGVTDAAIILDVDAFSDQLDDEIDDKILPRFRRGMQNIGAVVSSAFPLGEALIYAFNARDVAKHNGALRVAAALKNADVNVSNMGKDLDISKSNMLKDAQVNISIMEKNLEVSKANLTKNVEVARINIGKNLDISKSNLTKGVEVARINIGKDLDISKSNMLKNVEVSRMNLDKDVRVGGINIDYGIGVVKENLSKEVQIALANLNKDLEVSKTNVHTRTEFERLYLMGTEQMINFTAQKYAWLGNYAQMSVESNRIKIVAKSEQAARDAEIDENDALWDLEVFQYGANLLAAPAGGTAVTRSKASGSSGASVLGGAMAGAAAGSMVMPGWGTAIGAVVGGAAAYLSQ